MNYCVICTYIYIYVYTHRAIAKAPAHADESPVSELLGTNRLRVAATS